MSNPEQRADYDSPWKEAISLYFPDFLKFFFPEVYQGIDWSKDYTFLDKEFQQIIRQTETGRRDADKLVKVWLKNGRELWILIHIEVQSQVQISFPERIYIYNSRIYDVHRCPVLSLAVLADEQESWRPDNYSYGFLGGRLTLEFPIAKLLDYSTETLEASSNPFAVIVLAHRETQASAKDPNRRYREKLRIAKSLYQRGYERADILELFRLIDWMMSLPEQFQSGFQREIVRFEEESKMPYITSIERFAREEGLQQGIEQGLQQGVLQKGREAILEVLEVRFSSVSETLVELLNQVQEKAILSSLLRQSITVESLDTFEGMVREQFSA
ncbi:hypothetical protein [Spirulina subsalsa]|uniref:hypothetical protein n=1 Tax=Spirulina subsalsa TaxID=54311 RepID=UPI0003083598|nr:hypothetical protein [Spirulina subsalsa]